MITIILSLASLVSEKENENSLHPIGEMQFEMEHIANSHDQFQCHGLLLLL